MRTKKALKNSLSDLLLQIIMMAQGFIITRLIIEHYGSVANGLVSSISQIIIQFRLIEMGLGGAIIYSLYTPLANKELTRINAIASAGKQAYRRVSYYFFGLLIILAALYPMVVKADEVKPFGMASLIVVMGSAVFVLFHSISKYNVFFFASQLNHIINTSRIIYSLVGMFVALILIVFKYNLAIVYASFLFATCVQYIYIRIMFKRYFNHVEFNCPPDKVATEKRFDVMIHQVSGVIVVNTPIVLLTLFSTLNEVSVYAVYMLVFTGINRVLGIFNNGLVAGFGDLFSRNDHSALRTAYSQYEYLYYILTTAVYITAALLIESFISLYTRGIDDANYGSISVAMLFIVMGVLNSWKMPQGTIIHAAGHFKQTRHRAIIEAGITLTLGLILVHRLGLHGVLIASIAGLAYRSIDLLYTVKLIEGVIKGTIVRLARLVACISAAIVVLFSVRDFYKITNFIQWIYSAVVIAVITSCFVLVINYLLEKDEMSKVTNRFKRLLRSSIKSKGDA